jgi:hypothetical protein
VPPPLLCRLVDEGLEVLPALPSLRALNLQDCWQVTERGLAHLSRESSGGGRGAACWVDAWSEA